MIEQTILRELTRSESFSRRAIPHIRHDYFTPGTPEKVAFEIIEGYTRKYNSLPSAEAMAVELTNRLDLTEDQFRDTGRVFNNILAENQETPNHDWLVDQTEKWCQDRALASALKSALQIMNEKGEKGLAAGKLPKLFQDALAVTFDTHIGHDYIEDAMDRFHKLRRPNARLPLPLTLMNKMTKGGLKKKTLNVAMAVSGAGKTLWMCDCAAFHLMLGKNVLYITLEVSEDEGIATRIDANLMNIDIGVIDSIPEDVFKGKIAELRKKQLGKLIVKEYPPRSVGSAHFRHLLNDLKAKKNFVPDVIYIDYLNLCVPCTLGKGDHNSYERVKAIAEELRAIGVEFDIPIVSATQTNRTGYGSTDVGMENTSDSIGLPMTVDLMFALVSSDELERMGQYQVIQLKSRYDDKSKMPRFYIGVDKSKMRLYDTESSAQEDTTTTVSAPAPAFASRQPPSGFAGFK